MTPLDKVPVGEACRILEIADPVTRDQLLRLGLSEGSLITPSHRLPAGGPVVVRSHRQQIALGRTMASRIRTTPET